MVVDSASFYHLCLGWFFGDEDVNVSFKYQVQAVCLFTKIEADSFERESLWE